MNNSAPSEGPSNIPYKQLEDLAATSTKSERNILQIEQEVISTIVFQYEEPLLCAVQGYMLLHINGRKSPCI